jgi:hypothetical protein
MPVTITDTCAAPNPLDQRMWMPLMLRAMTRRWISEVPSKMV